MPGSACRRVRCTQYIDFSTPTPILIFQAEFERKKEQMRVAKEVAKRYLDVAKKSTNTGPNEDLNPEFKKVSHYYWSRPMGKPTICIGENKGADQLRSNREADQRLCFRYSDSTIPLLLKSEISSFKPASVAVQTGLCRACSETTLLVLPLDREMETKGFTFEPVREKTNNLGSDQVRHIPACTVTEDG